MAIVLLTHERELTRPSNTGRLVIESLPELCRQVVWSRVELSDELIRLQQACLDGDALLLFPQSSEEVVSEGTVNAELSKEIESALSLAHTAHTLIILDATWQEARKMMRQSPYLQLARRVSLSGEQSSNYQKRRNQIQGGLCTSECVEQVLLQLGMQSQAAQLAQAFRQFNLE